MLLFVLVGCSADKYVNLVQNGKYMSTEYTNGDIFYRCFNSCKWSSHKNFRDGKVYVVFTGKALVDGKFQLVKVNYRIIGNIDFEVADFYINDDPVLSVEFAELVTNLYFR